MKIPAALKAPCMIATIVCASTQALAQQGTLKALGPSGFVYVWKDKASHDEALGLIQGGVHKTQPQLITKLLSCRPSGGDTALITSVGLATHDILVTSGSHVGCRGNIAREEFVLK